MTYELHPLCTLFPRMEGDAFEALVEDIRTNGLREPITLHNGMILDGGNRYRACLQAGVDPVFREFSGENVVTFVLSANLHRRHMTAGQQAAIVAAAQDWATAHAPGSNQHQAKASGPATLPDLPLASVADRATASGASERTQRMADKVARADPELAKQVARGEVSLPKAVEKVEAKKSDPKPDPKAPAKTAEQQAHEEAVAEAADEFDAMAELEAAQREIEQLNVRIKALAADDTAAELARQIEIRQGIEARLAAEQNKVHELDRQLRSLGRTLAELRRLTKAENNTALLNAVRAMVKAAA